MLSRIFGSALLALAFAQVAIPAQTIPLPSKVVHLYVDPTYGEDLKSVPPGNPSNDLGITKNPGAPGVWTCAGSPPQFAPEVLDSSLNQLVHNGWPYRTITSAVRSVPQLPYSSSVPIGAGVYLLVNWSHAIVHLLPGMYGRNGAHYGAPFYPNWDKASSRPLRNSVGV